VRRIQRVQNLARILHRLVDRQRPLERLAFDILHHQVIRPDIVQRADMRMVQRRDRPRFPLEALGEFYRGDLDRDGAIKPRITRLVHLTHAARADGREDFIRTETCAGSLRHRFGTILLL